MLEKTATPDSLDIGALLEAFPQEFVEINQQEQALAIVLYRLLAFGKPVSLLFLAEASVMPAAEVEQMLEKWNGVYRDDTGKVIGFWGLALDDMSHKLLIDGRELYAWCAWDTLFLPAIIGKKTQITSHCAQSGKAIQLTLDLVHIVSVNPGTTVLSFVTPDEKGIREDVINSFCHSVLFFASTELGEQWIEDHPGIFLMSVDNAFKLAQMFNRRKFPQILLNQDSKGSLL